MRQHARDRVFVHFARGRSASLIVLRLARAQAHEVVDQRVARPGVASHELGAAVDESDIGDAAEIEYADGIWALEQAQHRAMKHRHHRRAVPSGSDVGGAKIVDDGNAESGGERGAVAELNGEPAIGTVQHGLAVEAHHGDFARPHAVRGQERLDRLRVHVGHQFFGPRQHRGTRVAVGEIGGNRNRPPHDVALRIAVGAVAGRAEAANLLTVGLDERYVHPVVGGATHQADCNRARH